MLKLTARRKEWFTLSQDDSGETQVQILHLKPGEVSDIEAKSNQIVGRGVGDDFTTEVGINLNQRTRAFVTRAVCDWKGFEGTNGRALPCNDANKLKVLKEFDWFADQIEDFREELAEMVSAEEEDAEKN